MSQFRMVPQIKHDVSKVFDAAVITAAMRTASWRPGTAMVCSVGTMSRPPDIRWQQRFDNFARALALLREALARGPVVLNQLEKEGVVQRFEYTLELAWKTVKDYLEESGVVLTAITPRQVVKDAFAAKILADGQTWIAMIDHRNLLSHTYDPVNFEEAVVAIHGRYLAALQQLHDLLADRRDG
jgi:nucleotidyltransferase substrate binding protein (TIGR01987 family)